MLVGDEHGGRTVDGLALGERRRGRSTTTWPSCSMRTQAWPNFVILMAPNYPVRLSPAGCPRSTSATPRPARRSASPGGRSPRSARWRAGAARSRSRPCDRTSRHLRRCTHWVKPVAHAVLALPLHRGRRTSRGADSEVLAAAIVPATPLTVSALSSSARPAGADVEHRLLDVEGGEHVLDHLVRDRAGAAHVQHLGALGVEHLQPQPGVGLARRLLVGGWCRRAAPRRRCCAGRPGRAATARCRTGPRRRCAALSRSSPAAVAFSNRAARASASSRGSGARQPQPAHQPGQRRALHEQRPGRHDQRGQDQRLAVVERLAGSRTPPRASPRRASRPSRARRCAATTGARRSPGRARAGPAGTGPGTPTPAGARRPRRTSPRTA